MTNRLFKGFVQYSTFLKGQKPTNKLYLQIKTNHLRQKANFILKSNHESRKNLMDSTPITNYDNDDGRSKALKICSDQLGGAWTKITPSEMSFMPISGGMSNFLFCCSLPESVEISNGEPSQVLLRFYGYDARNCDVSLQLEIFNLLSLKELGPKLYGKFEEGRIEEFLSANSLTCNELMNSEISSIIAKKLAIVHSLDVPIDKGTTWLKDRYTEFLSCIKEQVGSLNFNDESRNSTKMIAQELGSINFDHEIKFLIGLYDKANSPAVFSHNDLHQGNILLANYSKRRPTLEERIIFIDFEYCSYNYRAFDIANHFCEWCFEYDTPDYPHFVIYQDRFPSEDAQRAFVRCYLEKNRQIVRDSSLISSENINIITSKDNNTSDTNNNHHHYHNHNNAMRNNHCDNNNGFLNGLKHITNGHSNGINHYADDEFVLLEEIKPFLMGANLLWTLWCMKNANQSNIKFGYWEHAMARWKLYSNFKASYISERKTTFDGGRIQ